MATGTILLDVASGELPDGSASNAAPGLMRVQGSEANPKKHFVVAAFDPATDEHLWFKFRMPADYASGGTAKLLWMANATSGTCRWGVRLGAITPGDADTPVEHASAAASTAGTAATTEAYRLLETSIAIANLDSVAAGDLVFFLVYRDANGDSGTDDLAVDALLIAASIEYTTT